MDRGLLDEYALDFLDEIHPEAKRVIKQMLAAAVDYPNVHVNALSITPTRDGGFDYFLGMQGGGTSPLQNHQRLPVYLREPLIHHGILGPKTNPQWTNSVSSFTDSAFEWHRTFGGPDDDEVRRRIGRVLYRHIGVVPPPYVFDEVAQSIGIPSPRVERETHVLMGSGFVESVLAGDREIGILALTRPLGIRWAAAGFPPIGSMDNVSLAVAVNLRVDVNTILQQTRGSGVDQALLDAFEVRLGRLEEELEKPDGEGSFEKVKDIVETANNSRQLLESLIPFMMKHWDKIQALSDAAGNILPG
jgi:hypothetical protein